MTVPLLRFEHLEKRYGDHVVFHNLHYAASAGCMALADDIVGKSTLLNVLGGALKPDAGDVWINGISTHAVPGEIASVCAYIPDDCMVFPTETGRAFLERVAAVRATTINDSTLEWADRFDLLPHLDKRFEQMSRGARKKTFLTSCVLGTPSVIIADEPSGGLDASGRSALVDLFQLLRQDRVVLFASYDEALKNACRPTILHLSDLTLSR